MSVFLWSIESSLTALRSEDAHLILGHHLQEAGNRPNWRTETVIRSGIAKGIPITEDTWRKQTREGRRIERQRIAKAGK
jgi:hypothetical protein